MTNPLDHLRAQARQLADQRAEITAQTVDLAALADAQRATAASAAVVGDAEASAASANAAREIFGQRRATLNKIADVDGELAKIIAALQGDPCDLESDVPLALLPVRLETRYSADGATLRVRIFPDDVHVDRLDHGLSDEERAAGIAYWQAIWDGSRTEDVAWQTLLAEVKPSRAEWVAAALSPDLTTRPNPPVAGATPVVRDPPALQQLAPVARALPDRFVVVAVQGEQVSTATGAPVPPSVIVGLPPTADPSQLIQNGTVTLGPGMEWMIDPDEAERVGLLVNVPLAQPNVDVERVFAIGVRSSLGPEDSAIELATLLQAHRYADRAAFLAPGTPTNNTESDRAAWTARSAPNPPPTWPINPSAGSDALNAATALGMAATSDTGLSTWPGPDVASQIVAAASNTALWQATWGTFIDRIVDGSMPQPTISDALRESWRDWWQDNVRGGGPLPLIRLGDQPYGLLPVSSVQQAWQPSGSQPIEAPLLSILRNSRPLMAASLAHVPSVGTGSLDDVLLEALGSAPQMLGLRVRSIGSDGLFGVLQLVFGMDPSGTNQATQDQMVETLFLQLGIDASIGFRGVVGKTTRPLGLALVVDDLADSTMGDLSYVKAMFDNSPRTVGSVLQALLEICRGLEQKAVDQSAPGDQVGKVFDRGSALLEHEAATYRELIDEVQQGRVEPARLHAAAAGLERRFGAAGPSLLATLQPVLSARTSLATAALSINLPGALNQQLALSALSAWLRAKARFAEFQQAALTLAATSIDQRGYAVAATLDCASHRYDAWVSSLPTSRLAAQRAASPTGVLLGAYGWVEGLSPGGVTTRPGGYVHAPSLSHAATAGVLRSGYLTHNRDADGSAALALDLASARVRLAESMLDGVRQGQPLGALVGYLIERRLHEQRLDVYTLSLRSLAPIGAGRLVDHADALPAPAQEAIGANNVVDGVRLLALPRNAIWTKLSTAPSDNRYLDASKWPKLTDNQAAVGAILDEAASAYDAVSDVLLAESVHQLVQGNTARAAATMSAAAGGDVAPVEPDVVRTPTRAVAVTHRILLLLDDTAPGSGGWSSATPRAQAEPRLAAWAENRLGPATSIVIHVAGDGTQITLDVAGLAALDVIFDAAGATVSDTDAGLVLHAAALDARLRAAVTALGTDPLPVVPDPAWPVGTRAIGEVAIGAAALCTLVSGGLSIDPRSFARPNDKPVRATDPGGLDTRLQPVVAGMQTVTSDLAAALAADPIDEGALSSAVDALRPYGISLGAGGVATGRAVLAEATKRASAAAAITVTDAQSARAVGEALFGSGFLVLAPVTGAADLFSTTLGSLDPGRSAVRRWLLDLATVRPDLGKYTETLLMGDATGSSPGAGRSLQIAQLAASGTAGTATWLGLALAPATVSPDQPVTDVVLDAPSGYTGSDAVAGLVVDEWVEQLPRRNKDGSATITTGVAVNANAPGARAPQAILLAVTPDGSRWSTDALIALLTETRELAGLRAVTLERIATPSPILPAIQDQSWSLQGEPTFNLSELVTKLAVVDKALPYVKELGQ